MEVGPRDGLQNETAILSTENKLQFIKLLVESGLSNIEATSFVSPKRVPQLADAAELFKELDSRQFTSTPPNLHTWAPALPLSHSPSLPLRFSALVPNRKGLERALAAGCRAIALFTAASETFNQKNIGMAIAESLENFREIVPDAKAAKCWIRGYVSTAFHCPYEGSIEPENVIPVVDSLLEMGVDEISIGDTIGHAVPTEVARLTELIYSELPALRPDDGRWTIDDPTGTGVYASRGTDAIVHRPSSIVKQGLAYHFHDTRGTALANVLMALEYGVSIFDSSAGGAGGCPFAPGAAGNLATEDLVFMLNGMGIATGVNLHKLVDASRFLESHLGHKLPGRYLQSQ